MTENKAKDTGERTKDEDLEQLIMNMAVTSRSQFIKSLTDPRRNIDDECGYPETASITASDYKNLFMREGVATRIVQVLPQESWQVSPNIFEDEDNETTTAFEQSLKDLQGTLQGTSWYQGDDGNPLWEKLCRADTLSGVGRYGVILLGLNDGKELNEPIDGVDAKGAKVGNSKHELLYIRVFDESLAPITAYEMDPTNPRYGQPTGYSITFADPASLSGEGISISSDGVTKRVHWTRVIHVADNLLSSELFGCPRILPVFNRVWDIRKLYSGSAEMYWRGAFPGISIETHPQLGGDVSTDIASTRTAMEKYMTGLQRYLLLSGASAKTLAPQVVDPTPQINTQIEAICIQKGIPKRIFVGSERGELASSQDDDTWKDRLRYRQNNYLTPRIIVPVIDRLIALGILAEPKQYGVKWQDFDNMSDEQQADIAAKHTQAMMQYVSGNVENLITPIDYFVHVLGFDKDKAQEILETTTGTEDDDQFTISPAPDPIDMMVKSAQIKQQGDQGKPIGLKDDIKAKAAKDKSVKANTDKDKK